MLVSRILQNQFCKIKLWIHGDDKSYKLIKIAHICERWMMKMKHSFYESLIYLEDTRAWLYIINNNRIEKTKNYKLYFYYKIKIINLLLY